VVTVADVIAVLDRWYPAATAEPWDAVGLTCGDPAEPVDRIQLALDCVPATVAEAAHAGAQLLITHHPLLLNGVHGVPATTPKGTLVHRMIRSGIAHFVAHTNADVAERGVSAALADLLGLQGVGPLEPDAQEPIDQLAVFVPPAALAKLATAVTEAGAGRIGHYDGCTFSVSGTGTFRPLPGADPADGEIGVLTRVPEVRLSVVLPRASRAVVLQAMRSAHPYEEVAFEITERPGLPAMTGTGRVGLLAEAMTLREFTSFVARSLPATVGGVRASGAPDRLIRTVAVCGGSGAAYAELARSAGADAYLTSDLKHHNTLEAVTERDVSSMALIDAAHWATESPWLRALAVELRDEFGPSVEVAVSETRTDPWVLHEY
jgi:dinuclear metal center YbgI/SA1388 family protein